MLTLLYFSYAVVLEYSWKRRYRALSLKNHWTGHDASSPVKWRIRIQQRTEVVVVVVVVFLSKRKALQPRKRYFGLFFEYVEQQQEIPYMYFACSERFKWKGVCRKTSLRVLQLCSFLKLWKNNPRKSTKKAACVYGMSRSSVPRTLRMDLKFFPYKISALHKLTFKNTERWIQHAAWAEGIRARSIFVWTGLLINRICGFGGRNFQRNFTKKQSQRESRPLGCHV